MTLNKHSQRRRLIKIAALGTVACAFPAPALSALKHHTAQQAKELFSWQGRALGAEVSLQIYHHDKKAAEQLIDKSVSLLRKLEGAFSIYDPNSTLSHLNRRGYVTAPPEEFVDLLKKADHISHKTDGAFDITVQPLWHYFKTHAYNKAEPDEWMKSESYRAAVDLIGFQDISISQNVISFRRPGMAATLNGIAQGYVTDQVSDFLKREGMTSVLVDMGEYKAIGPQPDNSPWRIALADPVYKGKYLDIIEISGGAVATSSGVEDSFDQEGKLHHLFDPKTGMSANKYLSVTVIAPTATEADALSTSFCSMSKKDIIQCLKGEGYKVILLERNGNLVTL